MSKTQFSMAMAALMERDSIGTLCAVGQFCLSQVERTGYVGPFNRRSVACEAARQVNRAEWQDSQQAEAFEQYMQAAQHLLEDAPW